MKPVLLPVILFIFCMTLWSCGKPFDSSHGIQRDSKKFTPPEPAEPKNDTLSLTFGGYKPTTDEIELAKIINDYRAQRGLKRLPLSPSLSYVARLHVLDLNSHAPQSGSKCNLHSWSEYGPWTHCCYTPDHAERECMWKKPLELTRYRGYGFEIAAGYTMHSGTPITLSPAKTLELWKKSPRHNEVMINTGIWRENPWAAMGVALVDGYASAWFGQEPDPECTQSQGKKPFCRTKH